MFLFSTRELASLTLVFGFMIWILFLDRKEENLKKTLFTIIDSFKNWKILASIFSYLAYLTVAVVVAKCLGLWNLSLLKETLLWTVLVGFPILLNSTGLRKGRKQFKDLMNETFGISALLALYFGLVSFAYYWELLLQFSITFLVIISIVANRDEKTKSAARTFSFLLGILGLVLTVATANVLIRTWPEVATQATLLEIGLNLWLPFALAPFIYLFVFLMRCETALKMLSFFNGKQPVPLRTRVAVVTGFHLSMNFASSFTGKWRKKLADSHTFRGSRGLMKDFRNSIRSEENKAKAAKARLKKYSGVIGVDDAGRQLDRRTFQVVQSSLMKLAYIQMGQHRNQKGHYRDDALEFANLEELPSGSDLTLHVSNDKQSWFAHANAQTGWVFAVGGDPSVDTIWQFDGPTPPSTFPSETSADMWATEGTTGSNINWG